MESARHFKGKIALQKILLEDGWIIHYHDGEISFKVMTPLGEREYFPDILASRNADYDKGELVCFEVDGKKGHSTHRDFVKMSLRDSSMLLENIRTVRISLNDLVGRKKQPVSLILEEISFQLIGK